MACWSVIIITETLAGIWTLFYEQLNSIALLVFLPLWLILFGVTAALALSYLSARVRLEPDMIVYDGVFSRKALAISSVVSTRWEGGGRGYVIFLVRSQQCQLRFSTYTFSYAHLREIEAFITAQAAAKSHGVQQIAAPSAKKLQMAFSVYFLLINLVIIGAAVMVGIRRHM
jgi:hypothetical protein